MNSDITKTHFLRCVYYANKVQGGALNQSFFCSLFLIKMVEEFVWVEEYTFYDVGRTFPLYLNCTDYSIICRWMSFQFCRMSIVASLAHKDLKSAVARKSHWQKCSPVELLAYDSELHWLAFLSDGVARNNWLYCLCQLVMQRLFQCLHLKQVSYWMSSII